MELTPHMRTFILNWGEKLSHWGLNRTEAQIYTLLFLSEKPLTMEEIAETLTVARSNVTNSLKELQSWKIVSLVSVMGDRRKHFECIKDVWQLFRQVVHEQKRREVDPMIELLKQAEDELDEHPSKSPTDQYIKQKMSEMSHFFDRTTGWYDRIDAMPDETLRKYVKLASTVEKILGKPRKK